MDFAAQGLLDGLDGAEREARRELLEQLARDGFTLEQLSEAVAENRLALLPVERLLGGRYTAKEIEAESGFPATQWLRIRKLLGLPEAGADDRVFGDEDIDAARATRLFLEAGISADGLGEITRVLGESMARLSATVSAEFAGAFLKPGDSEQDVAIRFAMLAEQLTPALAPVLSASFNAHLRESVRRGMIDHEVREAGHPTGTQHLSVCFADLVGFTRLGGELEVHELGNVAGRLAELATEVASGPVRLVKTIGDAAMFVSRDPGPLVEVALRLVAAVEEDELPSLRAGIASGQAAQRAGDYFGHPVNLASRVTGVARPGSVLCTDEVKRAAEAQFAWSFAGRFKLKGVLEPVPLHRPRAQSAAERELEPDQAPGESDEDALRRRREDRRRRRASR